MASQHNTPGLSEKLLEDGAGTMAPHGMIHQPPVQQQQQGYMQPGVAGASGMMTGSTNMTSVMLSSQPTIPMQNTSSTVAMFPQSGGTTFHADGSSSGIQDGGALIVDASDMALQPGQGLRGEAQQSAFYRDWPFAVAFIVHIGIVTTIAFTWGMSSLSHETDYDDEEIPDDEKTENGDDAGSIHLSGLLYLCLLSSLAAVAISAGALSIMTKFAEQLIQLALVTSCAMAFVVVISLFSMGAGLQFVGIFWLCMLGMSCLYAYSVWHRIPFAAANLTTGLEAVQTNAGVCMIAYGVSFAANLWVLIWALAFVGVSFKETKCDASTGTCDSDMDPISIFLLIFSHYWTSQVLKNVVHVTVAGVIGTWWFAPQEASHMWSPAIGDSFRRATTYSFGSICMASLLVALIRTLESAAASARRNGRGNQILLCIVECILRLIANIAEYFNKWALCYVGLYGYDFLTAGRKVVHLFRERGWSAIISDNLAARVLFLVCLVIGALTGLVGVLLNSITGWATPSLGPDAAIVVFFMCAIIGLSLAWITMGVVLSAVDTVIVSFAEAPQEFEANHPRLCQQMKTAWRLVYPGECSF